MHKNRAILVLIIVSPLLLFLGCMKSYGHFSISDQVTRDVQAGVVYPELRYYYTGRDTMPYAIIGIDRAYRIPSRYWIAFEPEPDRLKKMGRKIYNNIQQDPYGSRIIDSEGNSIGIWYSNLYNRSVRVDEKKKTVQILIVNPEIANRPAW